MGDIIKFKKPSPKQKHKGKTLCRSGFHKWQVVTSQKFDVKQGKLVTISRCSRCGKEKKELLQNDEFSSKVIWGTANFDMGITGIRRLSIKTTMR